MGETIENRTEIQQRALFQLDVFAGVQWEIDIHLVVRGSDTRVVDGVGCVDDHDNDCDVCICMYVYAYHSQVMGHLLVGTRLCRLVSTRRRCTPT